MGQATGATTRQLIRVTPIQRSSVFSSFRKVKIDYMERRPRFVYQVLWARGGFFFFLDIQPIFKAAGARIDVSLGTSRDQVETPRFHSALIWMTWRLISLPTIFWIAREGDGTSGCADALPQQTLRTFSSCFFEDSPTRSKLERGSHSRCPHIATPFGDCSGYQKRGSNMPQILVSRLLWLHLPRAHREFRQVLRRIPAFYL